MNFIGRERRIAERADIGCVKLRAHRLCPDARITAAFGDERRDRLTQLGIGGANAFLQACCRATQRCCLHLFRQPSLTHPPLKCLDQRMIFRFPFTKTIKHGQCFFEQSARWDAACGFIRTHFFDHAVKRAREAVELFDPRIDGGGACQRLLFHHHVDTVDMRPGKLRHDIRIMP